MSRTDHGNVSAPDGQAPAGVGRDRDLDALRGLAVIGVILIHVAAGPLLFPSRYQTWERAVLVSADFFARVSVPFFIAVSGLLLMRGWRRRPLTYGAFVRRRLARIWWPYLLWTLIHSAITEHTSWLLFWRRLGSNLVLGDASYHTYFVVIIVHLYLVFPLLAAVWLRLGASEASRLWAPRLAVLLPWLVIAVWPDLSIVQRLTADWGVPGLGDYLLNGPLRAARWLPYFLLGMVAEPWYEWLRANRPPRWAVVGCLLAVAGVVTYRLGLLATQPDADHAAHFTNFGWHTWPAPVAAYTGIILSYALLRSRAGRWLSTALAELGQASYGIYLSHVFFLILFGQFRLYVAVAQMVEFLPLAGLLNLAASYGAVRLLARLPGLRLTSGYDGGPVR